MKVSEETTPGLKILKTVAEFSFLTVECAGESTPEIVCPSDFSSSIYKGLF
ncbi:hypothetical protein LEMLEM_LOCUS18447 [Lemmus lemmus]